MANTTKQIASTSNGLVTIDVTYDNNSYSIRGFTITNNGSSTVTATVTKPSVGGSWSLVAGPGQTVSDTVPANLVSFEDDGTGNPAIPWVILLPYWWGEFGIWHWVVTT
jgi:hypothetical protein